MNWNKIYNDFIEDRKIKTVKGYYEKHHILPRALGGTDEKENLIILSASDHLFAHLLLARIYGGTMWFALKLMLEVAPNNKSKRLKVNRSKRFHYELMRKNTSKYYSRNYSGANSPNADTEKYMLHNDSDDGSLNIAYGNRFELEEQTGLNTSEISALLTGRRMSSKGFYFKKYNPKGLIGYRAIHEEKNKNIYHFIYDGYKNKHKISKYGLDMMFGKENVSRLLKGQYIDGWNIYGIMTKKEHKSMMSRKRASKRGNISGENNYCADRVKYRFLNIKTNEVFVGTRVGLQKKFNLNPRDTYRILSQKFSHNKNWKLL